MKDFTGIRFMHVRVFDIHGKLQPCGGATIAYKDLGNHQYLVSMALCSPKDPFNKKAGRAVAANRLSEGLKHADATALPIIPFLRRLTILQDFNHPDPDIVRLKNACMNEVKRVVEERSWHNTAWSQHKDRGHSLHTVHGMRKSKAETTTA